MQRQTERHLLQVAIALASIVPLSMGSLSVLQGTAMLKGVAAPVPIDLDSHYRYLSGLLLGIGLVFVGCIPRIERMGGIFRALGLVVLIGGLARLLSLAEVGAPSVGHRFGLVMELIVLPLLVLWQARVAKLFSR